MTQQAAPRIKICGLKDIETIEAMDGLPINEIGFVFAKSKRQVTPETAATLIEAANRLAARGGNRPNAAGVFVDPTLEELEDILAVAPLDIVQLHGNESPGFCQMVKDRFQVQVWKALGMKPAEHTEAAEPQSAVLRITPFKGGVDAILIDSAGGGTGHTFDWETIKEYLVAARSIKLPLYVAGGLHADNVQELLNVYAPDGIDVSSGVETEGRKDIQKIRLFVRKVMEA
ncbi:phosphoribosylanthranilate isomerase [Paenibacillus harenae]|uniref:phosphoribosylanthranilate isomerase n=1 Tax=Paenibacillus harenae TaxID=306543 RepID=UPI00279150C7|nr:phosphoribosylanthranilate isomerase [Paenibacillus harenae]MDQ0058180.1 phosphoribosylanthranilate isomerase [Paenibacillus harenae]